MLSSSATRSNRRGELNDSIVYEVTTAFATNKYCYLVSDHFLEISFAPRNILSTFVEEELSMKQPLQFKYYI